MKTVVFLISALLILAGFMSKQDGKYNLVNKASEPVDQIEVSVCGQTSKFLNLKPGDAVKGAYSVKGDCHFTITGQFKSGKKINKEDGYVTIGFEYSHEIEIRDTDVSLKGGPVK